MLKLVSLTFLLILNVHQLPPLFLVYSEILSVWHLRSGSSLYCQFLLQELTMSDFRLSRLKHQNDCLPLMFKIMRLLCSLFSFFVLFSCTVCFSSFSLGTTGRFIGEIYFSTINLYTFGFLDNLTKMVCVQTSLDIVFKHYLVNHGLAWISVQVSRPLVTCSGHTIYLSFTCW